MDFMELIREKRREQKMTMKELADKVGVSEGTVSRWESGGITSLRNTTAVALSKALNIPLEELVGRTNRNEIVHGGSPKQVITFDPDFDKYGPEVGRIRHEILQKYVSMSAFAEIIDMPYSTLQSIFGIFKGATLSNLQKIATGLNTTIDGLMGIAPQTPPNYSPVLARAQEELSPEDLAKVEEIAAMYLKIKEDKT